MKRILVLGGGVSGVEAAISLRKLFNRKYYQIDLISDRQNLYIYPVSIWIPIGKRTPADVMISLDKIARARGFNFIRDRVERIASGEKKVYTENGLYNYDYLIIAFGAGKLKPKGIENTLSICGSPKEAEDIHKRFMSLVDKGSGKIVCGFSGNPNDGSAVRGGPVFEVLFNIDNYLRKHKLRNRFHLVFISPSAEAGKKLGKKGYLLLQKLFEEKGIQPIMGKKIRSFNSNSVVLEDGTEISSELTIFTPGLKGNDVLKDSDLKLTKSGFIYVDKFCRTEDRNDVYVVGDCADYSGPQWKAKQGHLAEVMARAAAKNIFLKEKGKPPKATFENAMQIVCVMDLGNEGVFVYRDNKKSRAPRSFLIHWMKLAWEKYYHLQKMGRVPSI